MSKFNALVIKKKLYFNLRDESPVVLYIKNMRTVMNDLSCYTCQKHETRKSCSTCCMTGNVKH